jgi:predicted nucleotide-binding protein
VIGDPKKVFIVHGHDDGSKNELASFLYRLGLTPIILHEHPNEGRTVVEKFEDYASEVRYAFVLLTPDDVGGKDKTELKPRARQNVVLELGYFMGKLGRNRVCGLYKEGIEIPSDVLGVLYLEYQELSERHFDIVQELGRAGYNINVGID